MFRRTVYLHIPRQRMQGFMIPLALFILVGIGVLAVSMNRLMSQSNTSSALEGVSLQAFFAAETGAGYAMHELMFNVTERSVADANCVSLSSTVPNFPGAAAAGLQSCSISLSCQRDTVTNSEKSFYTLRSTGRCGGGTLTAERTIEVSAFL